MRAWVRAAAGGVVNRYMPTSRPPVRSTATVNGAAANERATGWVTVQASTFGLACLVARVPLETARQPLGRWNRVTPGAEAAVWVKPSSVSGAGYQFSTHDASATESWTRSWDEVPTISYSNAVSISAPRLAGRASRSRRTRTALSPGMESLRTTVAPAAVARVKRSTGRRVFMPSAGPREESRSRRRRARPEKRRVFSAGSTVTSRSRLNSFQPLPSTVSGGEGATGMASANVVQRAAQQDMSDPGSGRREHSIW